MNKHEIDKSIYEICRTSKEIIENNLKAINRNDFQLSSIINASIDVAYDQCYPKISSMLSLIQPVQLHSAPGIPNELIEPIADLVLQGREGKKKLIAFTVAKNEPFFLPIWCEYYSHFVDDIIILDNASTDNTIDFIKRKWPNIKIINVPSTDSFNWLWITEIAKTFQKACLHAYEAVIFADADEFLIMNDGSSLRKFCEDFINSNQTYIRAKGWGVVHQYETEQPIMWDTHILDHRSKMWRTSQYDKTLLSKVPLDWCKGFHTIYIDGCKMVNDPINDQLSLLHLRDVDLDQYHRRCIDRSKMKPHGTSTFHGSVELEQVKQYFKTLQPPWDKISELEYSGSGIDVPVQWKSLITVP